MLLTFAADPKYLEAQPGIISVLHTWGKQLSFHPHIHCIVRGCGITNDGQWKEATKNDWRFLFPVKAMSQVLKGKFLEALKKLIEVKMVVPSLQTNIKAMLNVLYKKD